MTLLHQIHQFHQFFFLFTDLVRLASVDNGNQDGKAICDSFDFESQINNPVDCNSSSDNGSDMSNLLENETIHQSISNSECLIKGASPSTCNLQNVEPNIFKEVNESSLTNIGVGSSYQLCISADSNPSTDASTFQSLTNLADNFDMNINPSHMATDAGQVTNSLMEENSTSKLNNNFLSAPTAQTTSSLPSPFIHNSTTSSSHAISMENSTDKMISSGSDIKNACLTSLPSCLPISLNSFSSQPTTQSSFASTWAFEESSSKSQPVSTVPISYPSSPSSQSAVAFESSKDCQQSSGSKCQNNIEKLWDSQSFELGIGTSTRHHQHQPQPHNFSNSSHFLSSSSSSTMSSLPSLSSSSHSLFLPPPFAESSLRQCSSPRPPPLSSLLSPLKCSSLSASNSYIAEKNSYGFSSNNEQTTSGSPPISYYPNFQQQLLQPSNNLQAKSMNIHRQISAPHLPAVNYSATNHVDSNFYSPKNPSGGMPLSNFVQQSPNYMINQYQQRPLQHVIGLDQEYQLLQQNQQVNN